MENKPIKAVDSESHSITPDPQIIVTCGTSLFLSTLEMILTEQEDLKFLHFNPFIPQLVDRVTAMKPILVLLEQSAAYHHHTFALLESDLTVAILYPRTQDVLLLKRERLPLVDAGDLRQLFTDHAH